jgi:hypothetical protein
MKYLFLIVFGGVFIVAGVLIATLAAGSARAEAARVEALPSLTAQTLQQQPEGAEVAVEGLVSSRNPVVFRDFVAYVGEEYRGKRDNRERWVEFERNLPRLQIETTDGIVRFANEDYLLTGQLPSWQDSNVLSWNGFTGTGTKRYEGLSVDDTVTVLGTAKSGSEEVEVQVSKVFSGTRLEYIEDQRSLAGWLPWFGTIFAVAGLIVSGIGVVLFIRS